MTVRVAVTGADGFLGWHLVCHAKTRRDVELVRLTRADLANANSIEAKIAGVNAVVHLAGANRGPDEVVASTNINLAKTLAEAVAGTPSVQRVIYANSTQALGLTEYGKSKAEASRIIGAAVGPQRRFTDVLLPNLFGEHGRPSYNSFVATFCQDLALGKPPKVHADSPVELLHAQDASRLLLDQALGGESGTMRPTGLSTSVGLVAAVLARQAAQYEAGIFPDLSSAFEARLFNQLRSYAQPFNIHGTGGSRFDNPRPLAQHQDDRGGLVEVSKALGGESQTFCSTTLPGVTRGNHFHTEKVERFVVVSGNAEIALRRVGTNDNYRFLVSGMEPSVVDIPTLHTHAITNVGESELLTLFWANQVFDPETSDTYPELVVVPQ